MKKLVPFAFALVFLFGCASHPEKISDFYKDRGLYCEADITVHHDFDVTFTVSYTKDESHDRVVVLAPDSVSGLTYDFLNGEMSLEETAIALTLPFKEGYSPCDCLRTASELLRTRDPSAFMEKKRNGEKAWLLIYEDAKNSYSCDILVSAGDGRMLSCSFFIRGTLAVEADIKTFYFM